MCFGLYVDCHIRRNSGVLLAAPIYRLQNPVAKPEPRVCQTRNAYTILVVEPS
jgi:hypothetical protein